MNDTVVKIDLMHLDSAVATLKDLDRRAAEVTEDELVDVSLDWHDVASGVIPGLLVAADSMTADQVAELDALLAAVKRLKPALVRFDLTMPDRLRRETRKAAAVA
ncbi:MAG TPA: hypothetical protein VGM37_19790 [Armatimonadota bacterium]|jgi:hypothetical protein